MFFLNFWPLHQACGILVLQPMIKPTPPALEACVLSHVQLFATPMDYSPPVSPFPGLFQPEYWSELPFPSPG